MNRRRMLAALLAAVLLLASVAAANYLTSTFGMVPVGFGATATAGTYLAGFTFVLRDALQDAAGKRAAVIAVIAAAVVSFAVADPFVAAASAAAFLLAELADLAVYSPLRRRGYIRAAVASNVVGALVDSVVFLMIAGFPVLVSVPGQMIGKLTITALVVVLVAGIRLARAPRYATA